MKEKLEQIKEEALEKIREASALDGLQEVRVAFLGKKGKLTAVLKSMKEVAPQERHRVGQLVNEAREKIKNALEDAKTEMEQMIREARLKAEVIIVPQPE